MLESMEMVAVIFALCATIWLSFGLALSQWLRRWPARAHGILVAAFCGTLATPLLYFGIQQANWGLLPSRQEIVSLPGLNRGDPWPSRIATEPAQALPLEVSGLASWGGRSMEGKPVDPAVRPERTERTPESSGSIALEEPDPEVTPIFTWRSQLFWGWFGASALLLLRLCLDFLTGHRLARMSRCLQDDLVIREIEILAPKLGLKSTPRIVVSDRVASPVLWGWSRPARILVPANKVANPAFQGIYLHELGHLARRDHLSALAGEIAWCLIPWHPLIWWAKRTMEVRAEEACDDWAIACGCDPLDYADELVNLAPSGRGILTMAAMSKASSLKQRVNRLIRGALASPDLGIRWQVGLGLVAGLLAFGFAFLQSGELRGEVREVIPFATSFEAPIKTTESLAIVPSSAIQAHHRVRVHAKGMPVSGAKVWIEHYAIENRKLKQTLVPEVLKTNELGFAEIPQYLNSKKGIELVYAQDNAGRFGLINVLPVEGQVRTLEITPTKTIRGKVVHEGKPLSGVACQLVSFKWLDQSDTLFQDFPFPVHRESPRSRTDENGEFSFQGIPDTFAGTVLLDKEGFGLARVSIRGDEHSTIELARAGELQVKFPGEGGSARVGQMYWFLKDRNASTRTSSPLRISYGRNWRADSMAEGKVLRLGAGKYQFFVQHLGAEPFDTGKPVDFEIQPGKTTIISLLAEPLAEISGKVVDGRTGIGSEGVRVVYIASGLGQPIDYLRLGEVITDGTGRFVIHCQGDENYSLRFAHTNPTTEGKVRFFQKNGPFDGVKMVRLNKHEKHVLPDVVMNMSVRCRTVVTDEKGKPLATPFEAFLATDQPSNIRPDFPVIWSARGFSFEPGAVETAPLDPDHSMSILIRKEKAVNTPEFLVPSAVPRLQAISISDDNAVAVRGSVVDAEGLPVKGARLELKSGEISIEETKSNADGMFELSGLWPGLHYRLEGEIVKDEWLEGAVRFDTIKAADQPAPRLINDLKIILTTKSRK